MMSIKSLEPNKKKMVKNSDKNILIYCIGYVAPNNVKQWKQQESRSIITSIIKNLDNYNKEYMKIKLKPDNGLS